jgi:putative DNA primase/helicase
LDPPEAVKAATADYRQDMDVIGRWIEDCCDLDPGAKEPTSSLYTSHSIWANVEFGWVVSSARFARELADRGFRKEKGTGGVRCTICLRLKRQPVGSTVVSLRRSSDG